MDPGAAAAASSQAYLAGRSASGGDHSGAGAIELRRAGLPKPLAQAVAAVIARHHAGLADGTDLIERHDRGVPAHPGRVRHSGPTPPLAALAPERMPRPSPETGFTFAFLPRMPFSCLVDADAVETARFYGEAERTPLSSLAALRDRLDAHPDALLGRDCRSALRRTPPSAIARQSPFASIIPTAPSPSRRKRNPQVSHASRTAVWHVSETG